jgi:hypothetical protein
MITWLLIKLGIRCPECGGHLFSWSYGKSKCNRDGDINVTHTLY